MFKRLLLLAAVFLLPVTLTQAAFVPESLSNGRMDVMRQFAARCDGSTNDTAAIQLAINTAAGRGDVYVPAGVTCMTGNLSVPSNSHITVDGTLKLLPATNADLFTLATSATSIVFDGTGTLDGNTSAQTGGTSGGIEDTGTPSDIWVRGLTIQNFRNWPVNLTNVSHAWMSHLRLLNSGNSVEYAIASSDCWASHLYISGIADEGFAFYGGPHDCGIVDSEIVNSTGSGISILNDSGQLAADSHILIANIIATGNHYGAVEVNTGSGATAQHTHIMINHVIGYGNNQGNIGGYGGLFIANAADVQINGGIFHNDGTGANGAQGIQLASNDTNIVINNPTIFDEGHGSTNGVGINFNGATNVTLNGGHIYDDQGVKTMAFDLNGSIGTGSAIYSPQLGPTLGAANNSTPSSDTIEVGVLVPGGPFTFRQPPQLPQIVVSGLPGCNSVWEGAQYMATDVTTVTSNAIPIGGGTHKWPVVCDGTSWLME